jgi:hypothetical protein
MGMTAPRVEIFIESVALVDCQVDVGAFVGALEREVAEGFNPPLRGIESLAIPDLSVAFSAQSRRLPAGPLGGGLGRAITGGLTGGRGR